MIIYILAALVVLLAALMAFGIAALLHLQGAAYAIFVIVLLVIGIGAAVAIVVMHRRSKRQEAEEGGDASGGDAGDIDLLLNDVNRKLRNSQHGAKTLEELPLVYLLGQSGSAKTTTVAQSGMEAELVAGNASQGGEQTPTETLNLWFTGNAALLELGTTVRGNATRLARVIQRTRARAYRSAFGAGAAARAAIVCVSMDELQAQDGGASLLASARSANADLRQITRLLGMSIPVYVIVTKGDRISHFQEYVRNLSEEEVRQVVGMTLLRNDATPGTYADQAGRSVSSAIDSLVYKLGEFRVEMLDREAEPANKPGLYEFPREFGKLRKSLKDFLVEVCKPSQLNANPYLRGFYFTGIRARLVERAVSPAHAAVQVPAMQEAGATQFLNLSKTRADAAAQTAAPTMVAMRVPQWTFLPRLLPEVVLGDKSALAASKQSAPARLFRRLLYGSVAALFAIWLVFLLVSYSNNSELESRVAAAGNTLSKAAPGLPGAAELSALDDLRQTMVQLDSYEAHGAPFAYRFGLYHGTRLNAQAHKVYFEYFRPMLLAPAQENFLAYMRSLPDSPATTSDFGSYLAAYSPLKAYLITTSNPDKSQSKFLTPVFLQYWIGSRTVDPGQQQLAQKQIDFYAGELVRNPPYAIAPDSAMVEHTRVYLSKFLAETRIYQAMLSDADRTSPSIDFNKNYPGSASYVTDPHVVRGAFSRAGFGFMQDAIQHPEKYAQGETWVLGNQAGEALNSAQVGKDLAAQYSSDFLKEWHTFLISAHVGCAGPKEEPANLNALAGPASPLLALFYTVSHNTAVADPTIRSTFQPTQALVDPNATDRLIGGGNAAYMTALTQLGGAVALASQNPQWLTDAAVFAPVAQQVVAANGAAQQAAQTFNVDQQMHTEAAVLALMQAPPQCVAKLAPSPGAAANGGGKNICAAITPLLGKFPFAPNSPVQASPAEVDAAFAPESGALWTAYNGLLKQYLVPQGAQYVPNPAAPQPVSPRFAQYFNRAAHISSVFYPAGAKSPTLTFTGRFLPGNGVTNAALVIDGQRIASGSGQQITWNAATAQHASLVYDNNEVPFQGTWALFQLVRTAQVSRTAGGYRLDYPINTATTVAGHAVSGSGGSAKMASFEISGPGAELLVSGGLSGLTCSLPVVK